MKALDTVVDDKELRGYISDYTKHFVFGKYIDVITVPENDSKAKEKQSDELNKFIREHGYAFPIAVVSRLFNHFLTPLYPDRAHSIPRGLDILLENVKISPTDVGIPSTELGKVVSSGIRGLIYDEKRDRAKPLAVSRDGKTYVDLLVRYNESIPQPELQSLVNWSLQSILLLKEGYVMSVYTALKKFDDSSIGKHVEESVRHDVYKQEIQDRAVSIQESKRRIDGSDYKTALKETGIYDQKLEALSDFVEHEKAKLSPENLALVLNAYLSASEFNRAKSLLRGYGEDVRRYLVGSIIKEVDGTRDTRQKSILRSRYLTNLSDFLPPDITEKWKT